MNINKWFVFLLILVLLLPVLCVNVFAAEEPEFRYELTVDGSDTVEADPGDIITVTLHLIRTDADRAYTMYGMQDEIRYDSAFFQLVEDSAMISNGIQSTDIGRPGGFREFYMNYVSFSGGEEWDARTRIGSFQLKVLGESGVSTITNEDFLVSLPDGSDSYKCDVNTLTVVLSTECTVRFETNGGTSIEPIIAIYGETLICPEAPVRDGKQLVGWYKDIQLTEEWNFDTDAVKGNMTLYAKWEDAPIDAPATQPEGPSGILNWLWILLILLILLIIYVSWRISRNKGKKKGKYARRKIGIVIPNYPSIPANSRNMKNLQ